jgi:hypothetical protein
MEVTPVGWLCVLVGLASVGRPRWLATLLAASTVFSATAVVNFTGLPFGLQPYHWFGALFVAGTVVREDKPWRVLLGTLHPSEEALLWFLAWGVFAALTSADPGKSLVHMTHLGFGVAVLIVLRRIAQEPGQLRTLARALVWGALLAAAWGLLQFALHLAGIEYPAAVFNNSVGESAGGHVSTVLEGVLPSVGSVATEPSLLVRSLLPALVLVALGPDVSPDPRRAVGLAARYDRSLWLLATVAILSTSATGLVGLAAVLLGVVILAPGARWYAAGGLAAMSFALSWTYATSPVFAALADELVVGKVELGSGAQRVGSVQAAFSEFLASPAVGAGPGQITSDDLLVKLLANYGMVGALLLCWAMLGTLQQAWRAWKLNSESTRGSWLLALGGANAVLWSMDVAAGLSYTYGVFWVLWALLLAAIDVSEANVHS